MVQLLSKFRKNENKTRISLYWVDIFNKITWKQIEVQLNLCKEIAIGFK